MKERLLLSPEDYSRKVEADLRKIGRYGRELAHPIAPEDEGLYQFLDQYAREHQLYRTSMALPIVRDLMNREFYYGMQLKHGTTSLPGYYHHCLAIARMVVDLDVLEDPDETDLAMAAGLCHVIPENSIRMDDSEDMKTLLHMPEEVYQLVRTITRKDPLPEPMQKLFYQRIQENKIALLIRMIDRGNLVEGLHRISMMEATEYIKETKAYFFPMCIYARENYPELSKAAGLLLSKTKQLIDVAEILVYKYQRREMELMTRILDLKEENSRYRGMIEEAREYLGKAES